MKLMTFALKIGAHIAAGMGEMIPDLSREVAHLAGNPLRFGAAGVAAGKDIGEMFGLWRVRYRDNGQVAWVCRCHMYTRSNEMIIEDLVV
ncbi:hypothetical protein SSX86_005901 [Deinandra increscens subsp. villosa]|uniref:Uncharacterized protein n=1 Tax=Deinandra increscens subsp. villosa TaxID=3103831 RepID=A0AAP0H8X5_9ASTR